MKSQDNDPAPEGEGGSATGPRREVPTGYLRSVRQGGTVGSRSSTIRGGGSRAGSAEEAHLYEESCLPDQPPTKKPSSTA